MESAVSPCWRKSSYSGNGGGSCVETGNAGPGVLVRDTTQHEAGPVLTFTPQAWEEFLGHLRAI
jgi:hypothetical protein